ncbi:acetyl-CoA C-acyltransferase FadI [Motilimonas pumila]|uniref:Acetyl-CoA C-acyltransferase FadI n=1 Tax=Motilimonas pumila TaxID=2303987 RepID=A0A418YGH3_9GAMM|nr:acetyl-CoA C-acyltransferase FadI [Motilimonas pumila]RJG48746.1 acetyl-CoA C-acyltransferase FadI [Motilimonas pumila]
MPRVAIVAGLRTPFARQLTAYQDASALDLGISLVSEILRRSPVALSEWQQVVFGQVIQMPRAPNIAREIVLASRLPVSTDAYSVTRACATSFQALTSLAQGIQTGAIDAGIAGGADSSSVLPIGVSKPFAKALVQLSKAKNMGAKMSILRRLPWRHLLPVAPAVAEYSTGLTMGQSAEQMAKSWHISRQAQDEFAFRSHQLAAKAWQEGNHRDWVMPTWVPPFAAGISQDNTIRADVALKRYQDFKPAFDKRGGSVTAANSTPLTDGAAAIGLMSEHKAKELGIPVLGYIRSWAYHAKAVQQDMLMGPAFAIPKVLDMAGMTLADCNVIEMHEAFAAQTLANVQRLESKQFAAEIGRTEAIGNIDMDVFNPYGGSLAYGHPFAATGVRLILQALQFLKHRGGGVGLTSACAAGGLGVAMVVEVEE